ncbi:MAG: DUF3352 domain-containing protein [Planctomycetes bacterium]|nr:DUF3352 domain-containing protein [Planctomycetota bacterium]
MRSAALFLLIATLLAPMLAAQDEENQVDLAVAFPSTTMVYLRADTNDYFEALNPKEMFSGLEGDLNVPDLGEIARDRLELNLSDEEVEALAKDIQGTAGGLLDVALSGPKFEVVFKHKNLSALARALKEAQKDGSTTVVDVEDYYGSLIYEIEVPVSASEPGNDFQPDVNPFNQWLASDSLWVSIYDNKYLLIANGDNAVKDAVDFISYPDDPVDTLLGNSRYKEAIADFEKPQGLFFVNVQSVINTMERLAGDKGSSSPMQEMLQAFIGTSDEQVRFFFNLIQYEQFKSFAAGFWLDEKALTLRMDANLVFHNPPGWFETLRVEPKKMPLTEFIPADSVFALTDCVEDVHGMYEKTREFFFSRAKAAGQMKLIEGWKELEKKAKDEHASLDDTLKQLGGGQAIIVQKHEGTEYAFMPFDVAGMLGVKNCEEAEEYFHENLLRSRQGSGFRQMEGEITPVIIVNGVEIHADDTGNWGYAFIEAADGSGVFAVGAMDTLKSIARAKTEGSNLHSKQTWTQAKGLLWEEGSMHMYVNFGSLIGTMAGVVNRNLFWGYEDDESSTFKRDDTEKDDDPVPYLAEFFANTVIVGAARSSESSVSIRIAAAGWPDRENMRGMAIHYRNVERNKHVRDALLRVREAARTQYAIKSELVTEGEEETIKSKPARDVTELIENGYLTRAEWSIDPYGADEPDDTERHYALAEVPDDVDIRQAILCAYQKQPGLRGNYLAVLWNTHVVELTPEGLKAAIALAKEGKPLPADGKWYQDEARPLHSEKDPRAFETEPWEEEDTRIDVALIDDDGAETIIKVEEEDLMTTTEATLDQQEADSKED